MCKFFKKTTWKVHTQKICTENKMKDKYLLKKSRQDRMVMWMRTIAIDREVDTYLINCFKSIVKTIGEWLW